MSPAHLFLVSCLCSHVQCGWKEGTRRGICLVGGGVSLVFWFSRVLPDPASVLLNTLESSIHNCDLPGRQRCGR